MLRLLPSQAQFRGTSIEINLGLDIAEKKLIHLTQVNSFPVEMKLLTAGKAIKSNSDIGTCSPFLDSDGRIKRLFDTKCGTSHPFLLDTRHTLVQFWA